MRGLLIVNANVWGRDDADSVLLVGDRIEAVGREDELRRKAPAVTDVLDAGGRLLIPGLTDAHMHLLSYALSKQWLDLKGARSIEDIKRMVRIEAGRRGPGAWVLGRGWDQDKLEDRRMPTKWDLDEVAPRNPVLILRICGHVAAANTRALEVLGFTDTTPDPPGGALGREEGRLNGLLFEAAVDLALKRIPRPGLDETARLIRAVLEEAASYGIVELHSMSASQLEVDAYQAAKYEGAPKVFFYVESLSVQGPGVVGVKVFMDGSFGARTAKLREPYSDDPSNSGRLLMTSGDLAKMASAAAQRGLQVAVHAIGDGALEEVLKVSAPNVRIEHASLTPPDILEALASAKVPVSIQPHFIENDTWIIDRLGEERGRWVYAFKSLLAAGVSLAASSDAPVEPLSPWEGVRAAVERGRERELPIWRVSSEEALSPKEALQLYTRGPLLRGGKPRSISPGEPADLVLLSVSDIEEALKRPVTALLTLINGRVVQKTLRP